MTPFTLPELVSKAPGRFDESKHRRVRSGHGGGQFTSGGGGGGPSAPSATPRMGRLVSSGPSRRSTPPPLPGRAGVPKPGEGKPPGQLGAPKNSREAYGQHLWLVHRAAMIRRHVRDNAHRLTAQQRDDLTGKMKLAIQLAGRIQTGQFRLPDAAKEPEPKAQAKPAAPAAAPDHEERLTRPGPSAPADPRHNPDLDAAFASPSSAPTPTANGDLRHNPDLDAVFGDGPTPTPKPADKPREGHAEKPKKPRKGKGSKKARERDATRIAHEWGRLSVQNERSGFSDVASGMRIGSALMHSAAGHHAAGNHDVAEALRKVAHEYASGRQKVGDARRGKALFTLPNFVTKNVPFDEHKHRRGNPQNRGQFARGGQNATSTFTAPTLAAVRKPGRHANPQPPSRSPNGNGKPAHGPDPDARALTLAARIREVPGKLKTQVSTFVRGRYRRLAARYGSTGAKAILAATVLLTPVPMPGTSLIPIALAEAVLFIRRAMGKGYTPPLDEATIRREAHALLADLYEHCGEKWEGGSDAGHDHPDRPA